jgi:RNA polymerase sigma-70 factor (ECF subfamily)
MAAGPAAGLPGLDDGGLGAALAHHHRYHLARADLLARLGRTADAAAALADALTLEMPAAERRHLERRLQGFETIQSIEREAP